MASMPRRDCLPAPSPATALLTAAGLLLAAGTLALAQRDPLPFAAADGDRFAGKLTAIVERSGQPARPGRAAPLLKTILTEPEINAYLRYRGASTLPKGIIEPIILVLGDGRLAAWAEVDLDAVRDSRERGLLDPMRLLRGRMPIAAAGTLRTQDGIGSFDLESASASGVRIPKGLLQELVSFYTRTAANPGGFDLDAPFHLPAGIRQIEVRPGQAVIVQ